MATNWMDMISNPKGVLIRNYMLQLLGDEKFLKHQAFIDRLAGVLPSSADIQELGQILVSVYEIAYYKALNDYREKFTKLGYDVSVTHGTVADSR